MATKKKSKDLFTASEVARFCQVDLKTIHNWADRGEIEHFRTPGRHLRFRRGDVLDFLRKYGYPIPRSVQRGRPRVVVLDGDDAARERIANALGKAFDVQAWADPLATLVRVGADAPDVLVVAERVDGLDAARLVGCLKAQGPTSHVRAVVCAEDRGRKSRALEAGASAVLPTGDLARLLDTLHALLGSGR